MAQTNIESEAQGGLVERLAQLVGGRADVRLVYGEPIERKDMTIVPVARVRYGFGGGTGNKGKGEAVEAKGEGAGGGGGLMAAPAGFLILRDGEATYRAIRDPARMTGLVLAIAAGVMLTLRGVARMMRHRH